MSNLSQSPIWAWLKAEQNRQNDHLELIASENYVHEDILKLQGSILTNKYAEGYPGKRYYGGCQYVDCIETYAIEQLCQIFNVSYANVQPHSGSSANLAALHALIKPGDKIMGLSLLEGGHLTHGSPVNFSGLWYTAGSYHLSSEGLLDYDLIMEQAMQFQPKVLIAGYSAYSRTIDWVAFRKIADQVGAYLLADISHISGLIATGLHPSPAGYADVITSTTHKTLRGPRGGVIMTNREDLSKKINSAIFPGTQGGPLLHVIAAKARCFELCQESTFFTYQKQILLNAQALSERLQHHGLKIISGGTDNHLLLISLADFEFTGLDLQRALERANITTNRNTIPGEKRSPQLTSGLRIGSPALTTRGFKEKEMVMIADWIADAIKNNCDPMVIADIGVKVAQLCHEIPLTRPWFV
ncbi:MAG: serine hydroxymethyltransferase [Gammaproteobacteria bacterium]|nr:serine hydroxymethyltransferase [Gammaproteobacteria bacterium]